MSDPVVGKRGVTLVCQYGDVLSLCSGLDRRVLSVYPWTKCDSTKELSYGWIFSDVPYDCDILCENIP